MKIHDHFSEESGVSDPELAKALASAVGNLRK